MKGRLTEREKEELKKLLDDQDKPQDSSWLMIEEYAKKTKRQNPNNFGCLLCTKTHSTEQCPNRKEKSKYTYTYYNHNNDIED